jgi:hypothetical protein
MSNPLLLQRFLYDEMFSSKFCKIVLEFFVHSQEARIEMEEERDEWKSQKMEGETERAYMDL